MPSIKISTSREFEKENKIIKIPTLIPPNRMKGNLRPNRVRVLSLIVPQIIKKVVPTAADTAITIPISKYVSFSTSEINKLNIIPSKMVNTPNVNDIKPIKKIFFRLILRSR